MNFDKYLIPEAPSPASEGFLGNLIRVPTSEIRRMNVLEVEHEIEALESYMDAIMSTLTTPVAMESEGETDNLSNIAAKARAAGQKIKEGKKENNDNLVNQGTHELSASMQELSQETAKAKDPKTKSKAWMVAKIVGAVVATALLAVGAVSAGKALSTGVKSNDPKTAINGAKQAKAEKPKSQAQVTSSKPAQQGSMPTNPAQRSRWLKQNREKINQTVENARKVNRESSEKVLGLIDEYERLLHQEDAAIKTVQSGSVHKASDIHTHEDFDRVMRDKNSAIVFG